jgi:hypothetical protein
MVISGGCPVTLIVLRRVRSISGFVGAEACRGDPDAVELSAEAGA